MSESDSSMNAIGLADFIRGLRAEIEAAATEGVESGVRFKPGAIDLELQVRAERKGGLNGKVEFKVFGTGASLGGDGGVTFGQTQTLKMRLDPIFVVPGEPSPGLMKSQSDRRNR
jgi:hypothetical protein